MDKRNLSVLILRYLKRPFRFLVPQREFKKPKGLADIFCAFVGGYAN
jgi:hypothetical protein